MIDLRIWSRRLAVSSLLVVGCATLGNETTFPFPIRTSGVGPFRQLAEHETSPPGTTSGLAITTRGTAVGSGAIADEMLFYSNAPVLEEPPDRAEGLEEWQIDPAQLESRRILRAAPRAEMGTLDGEPVRLLGNEGDEIVLTGDEPWEGGEVFDPWPVVLADGRARLFYAGLGGIGLAEASGVDGSFTRVGSAPLLADGGDGVAPRSPTVVEHPTLGWFMYFERSDGIGVATSTDGATFTLADPDPSTAEIDPIFTDVPVPTVGEATELAVTSPGAAWAVSPIGRGTMRVYLEIHRDDGSTMISMAASEDGLLFERLDAPSMEVDNPRAPRPYVQADGITRLYVTVDRGERGITARALVIGITPADRFIADEPEADAD